MSTLASVVGILPDDFRIVLADVGSAGGVHKRWSPMRSCVSALLFEPREGGEPRREGQDIIYPIALGPQAGKAVLNVTALPNMSSTLSPNRALLETFRKKGAHTQITSTFEMPVDTLDAIAGRDSIAVDAIKVDTQGSEIEILRGAKAVLAENVILAEVEVSFIQRYQGQAMAHDIISFMAALGFELLELSRLKRYRKRNDADVRNISLGGGRRSGQLAYGDALFFTGEARLLSRIAAVPQTEGEKLAFKAVLGLLAYGKADLAAHIFDVTRQVMQADRAARLEAYFRSLRRWPFRSGVLHHLFDYAARHV